MGFRGMRFNYGTYGCFACRSVLPTCALQPCGLPAEEAEMVQPLNRSLVKEKLQYSNVCLNDLNEHHFNTLQFMLLAW